MARQYTTEKAGKLKRAANHLRQALGTDEELCQLGNSYLSRPLNPIIASLALEIYDGHRRLAGVLLVAGPDAEVPVCLTEEPWSEAVKLEIQMESAGHSRGLSAYEQYLGYSQWLALTPAATARDLAAKIHMDASHLSKVLSLDRCIPPVRAAASEGKLGVSDWYAMSRASETDQAVLLAAKLSGEITSRDQIEAQGRKSRNGGKPAVRLSRIKVPLPSGAMVSIAGEELSMDDVCEALAEALKDARAAKDKYDVKTWQSMCRDRFKPEEQ